MRQISTNLKTTFISLLLFCASTIAFGQSMYAYAYDNGTPALKAGDTYEAGWVVNQYNTSHATIIQTWQGSSQLSPAYYSWTWSVPDGNPWTHSLGFSCSNPSLPNILTQDFVVILGIKRRVSGTVVAGDQRTSGWMNTSQLTGSFTINLYIQ